MIERGNYLDRIFPFMDTVLIKFITGVEDQASL